MSPTQEAAMKMALEALESDPVALNAINNACAVLRAALAEPAQEPVQVESALQAVAEKIGDQCAVWYGIGARDVEEVLREAARHGLVRAALAQPVQEAVAQISANRVIAAIEEWKSLWWKVPPFASKVNRATREAITVSHNPLFALLLDAQAAKQMPKGCTTPSGCQQHGCHGECLPTEPQRPAEPVQEPVAVLLEYENGERELRFKNNGWDAKETPLYTAPPQRSATV